MMDCRTCAKHHFPKHPSLDSLSLSNSFFLSAGPLVSEICGSWHRLIPARPPKWMHLRRVIHMRRRRRRRGLPDDVRLLHNSDISQRVSPLSYYPRALLLVFLFRMLLWLCVALLTTTLIRHAHCTPHISIQQAALSISQAQQTSSR